MQVLDVEAWLHRKAHAHAHPIDRIQKTIAEYALASLPGAEAFKWSPFPFRSRKRHAGSLVKIAGQLAPNGLILALPDPAGIAQELAALMAGRTQQFLTAPERARKLFNLSAIATLEQGIKHQAQLAEIAAGEDLARDGESGMHETYSAGWMPGMPPRPDPQWAARQRVVTKTDLDRAAETTWHKYKQYFDDDARRQWEASYQEEARIFGETMIAPLAGVHVAWMKSERMAHYFDCCYDPRNWNAGLVYTQVVTACIDHTQDKQVCHDLYSEWLADAGATDAHNLLAKALKFNHPAIEDALKRVQAQDLDSRAIPWDAVLGVYKTAEDALGKGSADEMAKLLVQIAGPVARVLSQALDGTAGSALVAILGGIARARLEKVTLRGKRSEFRKVLVRELIKAGGDLATPKEVNRAVLAEMNRLRIRGGKAQDGVLERSWLVYIDPAAAAKAATAQDAAAALRSARQLEETAQMNWRTLMNGNVRLGMVTGLLQFVSLGKLLEDDAKAMAHEKQEAAWRLGAGYAALGGTFAEVSGNAILNMPSARSVLGRGWQFKIGSFLSAAGRAAGVAAGLIMAVWDGVKAYEEINRGNAGLGILYIGSGFLGIAVTVGFYYTLGAAIMFWLVAALVLVVVLIELNKPNKLMEWLQRCAFGKGPGKRGSLEEDQHEFELALKG